MGKKGTPHRKFSKEEKMKYVRLHLDEHVSLMQIEREYGIRNTLVSEWVRRYLQDGEEALQPCNPKGYSVTANPQQASHPAYWGFFIQLLLLTLCQLLLPPRSQPSHAPGKGHRRHQ